MSEIGIGATSAVQIEMVRVWLKNGLIIDVPMPAGSMQIWTRLVRSDGCLSNEDVSIPYDAIVLAVRHSALARLNLPEAAIMASTMPEGRMN